MLGTLDDKRSKMQVHIESYSTPEGEYNVEIKVLGSGCLNCKRLEKLARAAVAELGIGADIIKVQEFDQIMAYDIVSTPALVVDEEVVVSGRVPRVDEIVALLQKV